MVAVERTHLEVCAVALMQPVWVSLQQMRILVKLGVKCCRGAIGEPSGPRPVARVGRLEGEDTILVAR